MQCAPLHHTCPAQPPPVFAHPRTTLHTVSTYNARFDDVGRKCGRFTQLPRTVAVAVNHFKPPQQRTRSRRVYTRPNKAFKTVKKTLFHFLAKTSKSLFGLVWPPKIMWFERGHHPQPAGPIASFPSKDLSVMNPPRIEDRGPSIWTLS